MGGMRGGAGRHNGLSARRARRTKSRGYSRPKQTMADQSILKSAVLPASPMPLYYRENLRALGSTRDLSLLERVANRPPLARPAEQRSRVRRQPSLRVVRPQSAAEGEVVKDLKQLSSSMSCLRAEQREEPTRVCQKLTWPGTAH